MSACGDKIEDSSLQLNTQSIPMRCSAGPFKSKNSFLNLLLMPCSATMDLTAFVSRHGGYNTITVYHRFYY